MTWIRHLTLRQFRNLESVELEFTGAGTVVFWGDNGSGKTSLLEAIGLLATGRSFRSHRLEPLINYDAEALQAALTLEVFHQTTSHTSSHRLGIAKSKRETRYRVDGREAAGASELATLLPVQMLIPDLGTLLTGEPELRRRFLDWGLFHGEHSYFDSWKQYRRILKQRNQALRNTRSAFRAEEVEIDLQSVSNSQSRHISSQLQAIRSFDQQLCNVAEAIDAYREAYVSELSAALGDILGRFESELDIQLYYRRGWSEAETLGDALVRNLVGDLSRGFTQAGPHRADLRVVSGGHPAAQKLSRGQLKAVAFSLRLVQGRILGSLRNVSCVYLVDDLISEFDEIRRAAALKLLEETSGQVFIADVNREIIGRSVGPETLWFHVKHGEVNSD